MHGRPKPFLILRRDVDRYIEHFGWEPLGLVAEELIEEEHTCLDHLRRGRYAELRSAASFALLFDVHFRKLVYSRPEFFLNVTNAMRINVSIRVSSRCESLQSNIQQSRICYLESVVNTD